MENSKEELARARELSTLAGRWLALLGFQLHAGATVFSPSLSLYHDLLDPAADDAARLGACRAMRTHVLRRAQVEKLQGEERYALERPRDPYKVEWRTTERGAAFEILAGILDAATELYENGSISNGG